MLFGVAYITLHHTVCSVIKGRKTTEGSFKRTPVSLMHLHGSIKRGVHEEGKPAATRC